MQFVWLIDGLSKLFVRFEELCVPVGARCVTFDEINNVQLANHTSIALLISLIMDAEKIETDECGNRVLISSQTVPCLACVKQ